MGFTGEMASWISLTVEGAAIPEDPQDLEFGIGRAGYVHWAFLRDPVFVLRLSSYVNEAYRSSVEARERQLPTANLQLTTPKARRSNESGWNSLLNGMFVTPSTPRLRSRAPWELEVGGWELAHVLSSCYSTRSATAGSTRIARRVGSQQANSAITASSSVTTMKLTGSTGRTWNRRASR